MNDEKARTMKKRMVLGLCLLSTSVMADPGKAVANGKPFQILQAEIDATNSRLDEYIELTDAVLEQFRQEFDALEIRTSDVEALAAAAVTPEMLDNAIAETVAGYEAAVAAEAERSDLDYIEFSGYLCPQGSVLVGWTSDISRNGSLQQYDSEGNLIEIDRDIVDVTGWCRSIRVYDAYTWIPQVVVSAGDPFADAEATATCPSGYRLSRWSFDPFGEIDYVNTTYNSVTMRVDAGLVFNAVSRVSAGCVNYSASLSAL